MMSTPLVLSVVWCFCPLPDPPPASHRPPGSQVQDQAYVREKIVKK